MCELLGMCTSLLGLPKQYPTGWAPRQQAFISHNPGGSAVPDQSVGRGVLVRTSALGRRPLLLTVSSNGLASVRAAQAAVCVSSLVPLLMKTPVRSGPYDFIRP